MAVMGNSKTTVSSHCHQEDICNTSLGLDPTSTVHYDPAHSHAVCIGNHYLVLINKIYLHCLV